MTRPLIRKHGVWWRIFWGHTSHHSGDYYSSQDAAFRQAERFVRRNR